MTGAAGRVGSRFARLLASRGVRLFLTDIDKAPLLRVARETGAEAAVCDLLSEQSVAALSGRIFQSDDADLLINAGGSGYVRTLGMMRLSRELAQRCTDRTAIVINIAPAPPPAGCAAPFGYAGSTVAFRRLSHGMASRLADRLRIVTFDPLEHDGQVEDLFEQLIRGEAREPAPNGRNRSGRAA